jgi:predicted transcriptional regulator
MLTPRKQMSKEVPDYFSPREQQILDVVYMRKRVTANEVVEALPDRLSNSTVRTHLRLLEEKGALKHIERKGRFIYMPTRNRASAASAALSRVIQTFFDGSVEHAVASLLSTNEAKISDEELQRIRELIDRAEREGQ